MRMISEIFFDFFIWSGQEYQDVHDPIPLVVLHVTRWATWSFDRGALGALWAFRKMVGGGGGGVVMRPAKGKKNEVKIETT